MTAAATCGPDADRGATDPVSAPGAERAGASRAGDEASVPDEAPRAPEPPPAVPLLSPRDGIPVPIDDPVALQSLARDLEGSSGPIALDAERASGFRYGSRAFLVQIRRAGIGTALVDPVPFPDLAALAAPMRGGEWILHAATQDLPCLAELGLRPATLFDTELAGRLAGLPKVGLGPLVEQMLGIHLAKGHGADDWSRRPLSPDLLTYAALDVEVLVELRDAMAALLAGQGKLDWAMQEFAAIVAAPPPEPRADPWRRTSGVHTVSDRRTLAAVRELWYARDDMARRRDLSPHRVLPDSAMIAAASAMPKTLAELTGMPVFRGHAQRRQATRWFEALERARRLPPSDLPPRRLASHDPPPAPRWSRHDPDAAARLQSAKTGLDDLSQRWSIPVENLTSPKLVREVLWRPPLAEEVPAALAAGGARPWQIELVAPVLRAALDARA